MQTYLWPGYERQLLGGLQGQQNSAQFCDTLLQTEGISVPTHSCVLAALSPYLSQRISDSPSPPPGQKRQLQLGAVTAQTLLKLVGLLYSGVLEVKGSKERSDVLAAAHQFGITDLVQGQRDGVRRESPGNCRERQGILKTQDARVEAEVSGRGEKHSPVRKRSYASVGTQTVTVTESSVDGSAFLCGQTKAPNPEPASSGAPSIAVPHQNITPSPTIPSDGESTFGRSSGRVTNPTSTSALSTDTAPFPLFLNDSSPSEMQEYCNGDSSESGDNIAWRAGERAAPEDGKTKGTTSENERNAEQPRQVCRDETNRKDGAAQKSRSHGNAGVKDISKMKEMLETAQISIKVKLKRRTTGELWEVVNTQGPDETSLAQDRSCKKPQADGVRPPPTPAHPPCPLQKPEIQRLPPAVTNSFKHPEHHHSTTSDSQSFSSFTSGHNSAPESVPLPQPQGSVDESDEQIQKLLEDIMMSLNILPNLESDGKKSEPSHSGAPTVCRAPVTSDAAQTRMHAIAGAAECVYTVPAQPSCTGFPAVQPDGLMQQQEPRPPQFYSTGRNDGLSSQSLALFKSHNSLYPEASTSSVLPSAFFSTGQKLSYPACQPPPSHDDQHSLKGLPLSLGNGTQLEPTFSFPCMDDLRLPSRLSPLEPHISAVKSQPLLNISANLDRDIRLQPSLRRRPWLSENPGSLPWFPFSSSIFTSYRSLPADPDRSCQLRQAEKDSNPKSGGTSADGLIDRGIKSAAELKSYSRRMKEGFRCKHDDTTGSKSKRRHTNHGQDAAGSCSAQRNVKVSDGTKSCSVSLSSNNVLVKEREMAMMSSNMRCRLVGKPGETSTIVGEEEQPKESRGAKRTRIRTRGFVKKSQEAASSSNSPEKSRVVKPAVFSAQLVTQQGASLPKRKRGRPRKTERAAAIVDNKSECVNRVDWNSPKEEAPAAAEKPGKRGRKRRRNTSEVEVIPQKKTVGDECAGKAEEATNGDGKPGAKKQRHMVTLKEFQKLINQKHAGRRKPKEKQEAESNASTTAGQKVGTEDGNDTERHRDGSNAAEDQNQNPFSTSAAQCCKLHQDERSSSKSEKTSVDGDEDPPGPFDVAMVTTEREPPPTSPDEGMTGELDPAESPVKPEGSSHSDALLLPQAKTALDCKLLPRTPETAAPPAPPVSHADGVGRTSGCDDKGKEDDDEEVDVLVYSPENGPQTAGCGDGLLSNIDVTPDEDEEEDVNEIDVTGDEAE